MAPLTWRNVDAPDMGAAARILSDMGAGFSQGMSGLGSALAGIGTARNTRASAGALPVLAQVANEQGVDAAINRVTGMVNPNQWSPELQKAVMGLRESALGYEKTRADAGYVGANTARVLGSEGRDQTDFTRRIASEDQLMGQAADIVRMRQGAYSQNAGTGINPSPAATAIGRAAAASGTPYNERELLARTLQGEAGGEGYDGMLAAGAVIGNRVRSGKYGGSTVRDVVMAPGQFSAWNGVTGYAKGEGALDMGNMKASEDAYRAADAILSGQYEDPTGGATHYLNDKVASPSWYKGEGKRIGNHVFLSADGEVVPPSNAPVGSGNNGGPYDPALGANYSTVQQQGGSAYVPDVASLIPATGNRVLPTDYLKMVEDNWTAGDTARTNMDEDRERDRAFERLAIAGQRDDRTDARNEEVYATEQFAVDKAAELWAVQAAPGEAAKGVYADRTMSPQEKTAVLAQLGVLEQNAGNYFEAPELTGDALARDNALTRAVQASEARASAEAQFNPLLQIYDEVDATEAASGGDDAAAVSAQLEDLAQNGIDVGASAADKADILDAANRMSEKYGVNRQTVLRLAQSHLKSGFWREWWGNDVVINEEKLERILQSYGDPQMWSDARALKTRLSEEQSALAQAQADFRKYSGQSENLAARGTPDALKEADARAKKATAALERAEAIGRQIDTNFQSNASAYKNPGAGPVRDGLSEFLGQPTEAAPGSPPAAVDRALSAAVNRPTVSPEQAQAALRESAMPREAPLQDPSLQDGSWEANQRTEATSRALQAAAQEVENRQKALEYRAQRTGVVNPEDVKRVEAARKKLDALLQKASQTSQ